MFLHDDFYAIKKPYSPKNKAHLPNLKKKKTTFISAPTSLK